MENHQIQQLFDKVIFIEVKNLQKENQEGKDFEKKK